MERLERRAKPLVIDTAQVFLPLLQPAKFKGAWGGRVSGKTHFFAGLLIEDCLRKPIRCACVREVQDSLRTSVKQVIEDKITQFGLHKLFEITENEIRGPNSSLIVFKGLANMTADAMKSLADYNRAWYEEAQSLSARSLQLAIPSFRINPLYPDVELEQWFSWNPYDPKDAVEQLFRDDLIENNSDFIKVEANWRDNPWFDQSGQREIMEHCRDTDPDAYAHVWMGGYRRHTQARVFHNWRKGREEEFVYTDRTRFFFGADWGYANDPTVLVRCYIEGRKLYIDHEVYEIHLEIDKTGAMFERIPGARKWPIVADNARPETISYMKRHGWPNVEPSLKGKGSVEDGIDWLKNFEIIVHPRCERTYDELSGYSFKVDSKTDQVLPILEDKNNHVIDALRYAVEKARKTAMKITPEILRRAAMPAERRIW